MMLELERNRLSQADGVAWLNRDLQATEMVTIYLHDVTETHNRGVYCAIIPTADIEKSLSSTDWDLTHGGGYPGAIRRSDKGKVTAEYFRFGDGSGVEPLVIDRDFKGIHPSYMELCEEFRLFHRLYHDHTTGQFIKVQDDGNELVVAVIQPDRVQVRLKEMRQFLAIKEMHLSIQTDSREFSSMTLAELELERGGEDCREALSCWGLYCADLPGTDGPRSFSRLLGKRLVPPLPKEKSGFWGFQKDEPQRYVAFIIGTDENGDEVVHTADPAELDNDFGANPGAPHYLTPVSFRKQVLDKYYHQPGKYEVTDGSLRCVGLWSIQIDNHHDAKVCAWLGDLGRDLPYVEQLYWRSQNFAAEDGVSETFRRRQLLAEFTKSERPEHLFAHQYRELSEACAECLGWPILLQLSAQDSHHFMALRVPATNEQCDFDALVMSLTKILIDSLNEKALNRLIAKSILVDLTGGISRLEAALRAKVGQGYEDHIAFLRELQSLRSAGAAHRKGDNYRKIAARFGVGAQSLPSAFSGILGRALRVLEYLTDLVRARSLGDEFLPPSEGSSS